MNDPLNPDASALRWKRLAPWAIMVCLSLPPLWLAFSRTAHFNDDVYITLTYARNIAQGRGFVFNHPPPSLGTTSPLTALLLGGLGRMCSSAAITRPAALLTGLSWIAAAWVFFLWRRRFGLAPWEALLIALILLANTHQYWGGENALFMALLALSTALLLSGWWTLSGVCAGLLFLTRGEGALLGPVLVLSAVALEWAQGRTKPFHLLRPVLKITAGFFLVALLWWCWAYAVFGAITPNTLHVKIAQGQFQTHADELFHHALTRALPVWSRTILFFAPALHFLLWAPAIAGLWHIIRVKHRLLPLLAWVAVYVLAYTILRVPGYAWWYLLPARWFWALCVALGLIAWYHRLTRDTECAARPGLRRASAAALIVAVALVWTLGHARLTMRQQGNDRAPSYLALAAYLVEHSNADESVLAAEVGYLGYYTENRIIDACALTDLRNYGKSPEELATLHRPDYYIHWPPVLEKEVEQHKRLGNVPYALVAQFDSFVPGTVLTLYRRDDAR